MTMTPDLGFRYAGMNRLARVHHFFKRMPGTWNSPGQQESISCGMSKSKQALQKGLIEVDERIITALETLT